MFNKLLVIFKCAHCTLTVLVKKSSEKWCQHSVCIALVIQSDLATSNLSLSPDDWISSFPLTETKQRGGRDVKQCVIQIWFLNMSLLWFGPESFLPLVVQSKQTDSINSQDSVSWYQPLTPGCRRLWDHCTDEDAFHPQGGVLKDEVKMSRAHWHPRFCSQLPRCNLFNPTYKNQPFSHHPCFLFFIFSLSVPDSVFRS